MTTKYLAAAVALMGLAAGFTWWQSGGGPPGAPKYVLTLDHDPGCDLRAGGCQLDLPDGGRVTLGVKPSAIPPMEPLSVDVVVEDSALKPQWIDIAGVSMDMGFNRATLKASGPGRFTGTATIPVCVSQRMEWEATILMSDGDRWTGAPFRFDIVRNGLKP